MLRANCAGEDFPALTPCQRAAIGSLFRGAGFQMLVRDTRDERGERRQIIVVPQADYETAIAELRDPFALDTEAA